MNWYGELGKNEEFLHAGWTKMACPEDASDGNLPPQPPSTCGGPPADSAGPPASSEGTGQSSTSATEGGDPTDGDPTEGSQNPMWLCSLRSPTKCADITANDALAGVFGDDPYPMSTLLDVCWAPVETDPLPAKQISKCVPAANEAGAIIACEQDCNALNMKIAEQCGLKGCTVNKTIDCLLNGSIDGAADPLEKPHLLSDHDDVWRCPDGFDSLPAWEGQSDFVPFVGTGSLVMNDGTTAGMSAIGGYLGFTLSGCTSSSCTVTIDALEGLTRHSEGGYTDATGSGGSYELDQMGLRTRNVFSGTWNKTRGTVTFPNSVVEAQIWADTITVDGLPMSVGVRTLEIDQIVGSLRADQGPLTLNLMYNLSFGTASVSLTTQLP